MILLNKIKLVFFALIGQLLFLDNAFAGIGFSPPSPSDMSRQFINEIFGSLLDHGNDVFGSSIATFNGAVLIVGGILVSYTILVGTLGTAHDGEMLGKKFSSVWVPIRTAMGTALVMPVLAGGYCVMQSIVMWLIMQGSTLANMAWTSYMSNPPLLKIKLSTTSKGMVKKFVEDVYVINLCLASLNKSYADSTESGSFILGKYDYKYVLTGNTYEFGDFGGMLKSKTACGTVTLPNAPKLSTGLVTTSITSLGSTSAYFKGVDLKPIHDAHILATKNIVTQTAILATQAILPTSTVNYSQLDALVVEYIQKIETAAVGIANSSNASQLAAQQGWFLAGTWATSIINQQNKINNATKSISKSKISIISPPKMALDHVYSYLQKGYEVIKTQRPEIESSLQEPVVDEYGVNSYNSGSSSDNSDSIMTSITSWTSGLDITNVKTDTRHPLIIMSDIGFQILDSIMTAIASSAVIAGAAGLSIAGFSLNGTGAVIAIFVALAGPLLAFQGIGGMLAYILPNTPLFLWFGVLIGWTLMVIEAVIAAPLWAVMHLHPSGDDMTGKGGNGYMLVLGLILRPTLIIFGLIAAIVMSGLFGNLLNIIFFDLLLSNTPDGTLGFFGILFGTGLYAGLMMLIIKSTFSMMHSIPDQLMRWIGGGQEQLGQYAGQMNEGAIQKGAAIGGAAIGLMTDKAIGGAASSFSNIKQQSDINKQKELQDKGNKQDVESRNESKNQETDDKLGYGSSGMIQSGKANGFTQQERSNKILQANNDLGGKDSFSAESFRADMSKNMEKGYTFDQSYEKSMASSVDSKLGDGAHKLASNTSVGGNIGSSEYRGIVASLNGKMNNLTKIGQSPEEAREAISGMISNTCTRHEAEGGNIGSILSQESKKLKENPESYGKITGDAGKQMSFDFGDNQPPPASSGGGSKIGKGKEDGGAG